MFDIVIVLYPQYQYICVSRVGQRSLLWGGDYGMEKGIETVSHRFSLQEGLRPRHVVIREMHCLCTMKEPGFVSESHYLLPGLKHEERAELLFHHRLRCHHRQGCEAIAHSPWVSPAR